MFSLFKSTPFSDPQLGKFLRSRGNWRGSITIGGASTELVVIGGRNEPDSQAMQVAHGLSSQFPAWKQAIENALFEHYAPYAEALAAGEFPPPASNRVNSSSFVAVWCLRERDAQPFNREDVPRQAGSRLSSKTLGALR